MYFTINNTKNIYIIKSNKALFCFFYLLAYIVLVADSRANICIPASTIVENPSTDAKLNK